MRTMPEGRVARLLVYAGLPAAVVMAAAMIARAYDTSWIVAGQPIPAVGMNGKGLKPVLDEIQTRLTATEALLAGTADCPRGYVRNANVMNYIACKGDGVLRPAVDEMVKVGSGLSAFWIDRFEASVWSDAAATMGKAAGVPWGQAQTTDDYPATFPKNGQRVPNFADLYAVSKAGVLPSASLTWFQAHQACRASGKRLPTDEEWQAAASGTNDPGANNGAGGACVTSAAGPRNTGMGTTCVSAWGAQDMIGNVWEWSGSWWAGLGAGNTSAQWADTVGTTNGTYNSDGTWNIASSADKGGGTTLGLPAAALRGGSWTYGTQAGVFALTLDNAPSSWPSNVGFRCVARGL